MKSSQSRSGFSMVELLVSLAVIAVLVALLVGGFNIAAAHSRQTQCLANLRQLGAIILSYSVDHNGDLLPMLANEDSSGGTPWYSTLDAVGLLPGKPKIANTWNDSAKSIMTCPVRKDRPLWNGSSAGATLHYGMNQFPGFLNRTGKPGSSFEINYRNKYGFPKLGQIKQPSRSMMVGEITGAYSLSTADTPSTFYPHPKDGDGMNLIFWDGHAIYYRGRLPALGPPTSLKASDWQPEQSYPFF